MSYVALGLLHRLARVLIVMEPPSGSPSLPKGVGSSRKQTDAERPAPSSKWSAAERSPVESQCES